jgi:hypothetical protein
MRQLFLNTNILSNHAVMTLKPQVFKLWIQILCIADQDDIRGVSATFLSKKLKTSIHVIKKRLDCLVEADLLNQEGLLFRIKTPPCGGDQ